MKNMDSVSKYGQMEPNMKGTSKTIWLTVRDAFNTKMVINMKVIGKKIKPMGLESIHIRTVLLMKASGSLILNTATPLRFFLTKQDLKENSIEVRKKDMERFCGLMVASILGTLTVIKSAETDNTFGLMENNIQANGWIT